MKDKKEIILPAVEPKGRREFIKKAGVGTAGILAAGTAPMAYAKSNPIKWRLQTYSGAPLGAHVIKPQIEAFNRAANGRWKLNCIMQINWCLRMNSSEPCREVLLMRAK